MRASYSEEVLEAEGLQDALDKMREEAFKSLVVSLGGELLYLGSILTRVVGGRSSVTVVTVSGVPGFSAALKRVSAGQYLVSRKEGRAYTPRSLSLYMLESGMLSEHVFLERLKPYSLPCLGCNSTLKAAVRVFLDTGAIALPVCYAGNVYKLVTVADVAYYALSRNLKAPELLSTRVSRVAGELFEPDRLESMDLVEALRRYSMILVREGDKTYLFDSSSLQKALPSLAGVV